MRSDNHKLDAATLQILAYKHERITAYALALVRAGRALVLQRGIDRVASDDVPDAEVPQDTQDAGIPGSAINMLITAHVLERTGERRASKRPSANGRWISVYRLASLAVAETWIHRNGGSVESQQRELFNAAI